VLDLREMVAVIRHMKVCRHPLLPSTIFNGLLVDSASAWIPIHVYTKTKEKKSMKYSFRHFVKHFECKR
jgi:hypothetical protein